MNERNAKAFGTAYLIVLFLLALAIYLRLPFLFDLKDRTIKWPIEICFILVGLFGMTVALLKVSMALRLILVSFSLILIVLSFGYSAIP